MKKTLLAFALLATLAPSLASAAPQQDPTAHSLNLDCTHPVTGAQYQDIVDLSCAYDDFEAIQIFVEAVAQDGCSVDADAEPPEVVDPQGYECEVTLRQTNGACDNHGDVDMPDPWVNASCSGGGGGVTGGWGTSGDTYDIGLDCIDLYGNVRQEFVTDLCASSSADAEDIFYTQLDAWNFHVDPYIQQVGSAAQEECYVVSVQNVGICPGPNSNGLPFNSTEWNGPLNP